MPEITLDLEPELVLFYTRVALNSGKDLCQVLSDALFRLAGELSMEALRNGAQNFSESHCN